MSNLRSARLIMVTAANNNKFYFMDEQADGRIKVEYGRIEKTSKTIYKSAYEWDKVFNAKVKKGYSDMTHLYEKADAIDDAADDKKVKDITNNIVKKLVDELQSYATGVVKENYSVTSNSVTQAMVDEAQNILDGIAKKLEVDADKTELNNKLLELFQVIPRQMHNVNAYLFDSFDDEDALEEAQKMISKEQDILDSMAGLVSQAATQAKVQEDTEKKEEPNEMDILEQLGLEIEEGDEDDIKLAKEMMADRKRQFVKIFKVKNKETEEAYQKHWDSLPTSKEELFFHGSRVQNWWSILQTGLKIRPAGAIHTGSMWGDGVYFASKASKSLNYCGLSSSYWTRGSSNKSYLAIFKVNVGKQQVFKKHTYDSYKLSQKTLEKDGYDSVHAKAGASIINDEYIVYLSEKCTISHLIEVTS